MTESKPIYITDCAHNGNASKQKPTYSISPQKPTDLPPGTTPPPLSNITIDGELLSNKQLYEIIISKNMKIDKLLIDKGNYMAILQNIYDCIERGSYNKAKIIIKDALNI